MGLLSPSFVKSTTEGRPALSSPRLREASARQGGGGEVTARIDRSPRRGVLLAVQPGLDGFLGGGVGSGCLSKPAGGVRAQCGLLAAGADRRRLAWGTVAGGVLETGQGAAGRRRDAHVAG